MDTNLGITDKGAQRLRSILDASRHLYATGGYAGLSMRAVATAVGISLGNLQHYFPNREALIAAVLDFMMDTYQVEIDQVTAAAPQGDSAHRFCAAIDLLLERVADGDAQKIFIETWSLSTRNASALQAMARVHRRQELALYNLLRKLPNASSRRQTQQRARMVVLVLHGCMLELSQMRAARSDGVGATRSPETELLRFVRRHILGLAGLD